jgi:hypothetical protein
MGLDTYASRSSDDVMLTEEDERAFFNAGIELCGGLFSGNDGSFRGKVYWDVVFEVTEVSLTTEWLPPETVREMAAKLNAVSPEELAEINDYARTRYTGSPTNADEMMSLQCFFTICANRGLGLIGWF